MEENKAWVPRWTNRLNLDDNKNYILVTEGDYYNGEWSLDPSQPEDGVWFWRSGFVTCQPRPKTWRTYRLSDDEDHTMNKRIEMEDPRFKSGEYKERDGSMTPHYGRPKKKTFCNVVHFDIYKKKPIYNRDGNIVLHKSGENEGEPMHRFQVELGAKVRKSIMKNKPEEDDDLRFYLKKYLELTPTQHKIIAEAALSLKSSCHCGGQIEPMAYSCPSCDGVMVTDESLTMAEMRKYGDDQKRCPHCRQKVFPNPELECDRCEDPRPYNFNEVILEVEKTGKGLDTRVKVTKVIKADEFKLHNGDSIVECSDDGEPIEEDGQFIFLERIEELAQNSYDFDTANPVPSSEQVSKDLGLEPGDEGHVEPTSSDSYRGYTKKKVSPSRRHWR